MTKRRIFKILLWVLALSVVVLEASLRFAYPEKLMQEARPHVYIPDPVLGYRYKPGATGTLCIPGICKTFTIGPHGFPGAAFSRERTPGKYRIAIVGHSPETGIWLQHGRPYPEYLEQELERIWGPVEVLNFSLDGDHREVESMRLVNDLVLGYSPDLVMMNGIVPFVEANIERSSYKGYVLSYSQIDPLSVQRCKRMVDYLERQVAFNALYKMSYIVRAIVRVERLHGDDEWGQLARTLSKGACYDTITMRPWSQRDSVHALVEFNASVVAHGAKLVVYQFGRIGKHLEEVLPRFGVHALALPDLGGKGYDHVYDFHPNERWHRETAARVARDLVDRFMPKLQAEAPHAAR